MTRYYDRKGNPLSIEEFAVLLDDVEYKRVALDEIGDVSVSTVWLGIDHNFWDEDSPIIFETMIFGGEYADFQWRYCTEEEARQGHARVIEKLAAGENPES